MPVEMASDAPFGNVGRQLNKLTEHLQKGYSNFYPSETWAPSVNLYETQAAYLICVDLAGVDKDKIDIEVVESRVKIKGTRQVPAPQAPDSGDPTAARARVHLMEIDHGAFARDVELPKDVEREKITANYNNGMLWIELPKK